MATLTQVTDYSFDPEVLKCDIPVLANFWTEWSLPTQELMPWLAGLSAENPERVKVVSVEIEDNPRVTSQYNVLTIPTLILFKNGQEILRLTGSHSREDILEAIKPHFDQ